MLVENRLNATGEMWHCYPNLTAPSVEKAAPPGPPILPRLLLLRCNGWTPATERTSSRDTHRHATQPYDRMTRQQHRLNPITYRSQDQDCGAASNGRCPASRISAAAPLLLPPLSCCAISVGSEQKDGSHCWAPPDVF
jgi:hypothetical protein